MSDLDIAEEDRQVVHYVSPPEYIKRANARDHRVRHAIDLQHFLTYLQTSAGLLRELPGDKIDVLIADYLQGAEGER